MLSILTQPISQKLFTAGNMMMSAKSFDMVVIDFETTGAIEGHPNRPWQFAGIFFRNGKPVPEHRFSVYLKVPEEQPFNPYTPGRWASIREKLSNAPTLPELWPQLQPWLLGKVLVAHHAPTERTMLQSVFPFQTFGPWLDTLSMARKAYPSLSNFSLEALIQSLNLEKKVQTICPDLEPHDAYYDSVACAYLLEHILTLPGWNQAQIEDLTRLK